jgi:hypothetical protein
MQLQPGLLVSYSDCVWLRRFPLRKGRLPTFSVPADQVRPIASELS